jgi:hypothetical protein
MLPELGRDATITNPKRSGTATILSQAGGIQAPAVVEAPAVLQRTGQTLNAGSNIGQDLSFSSL